MNKNITLDLNKYNIKISNDLPFTLIAGPCVIESENHSFMMAENLLNICNKLNIKLIYKSSFDKANRTSIDSYRGIGYYEGLRILEKVKQYFNVPIITDVHNVEQCKDVAKVVDILQIPAFLSRQTDLIIAASETGKIVNIKKGQFLAPWDMKNIVKKFVSTGNNNVLLCERGVSFGYNNLVVDMTSLPIMKESGYPVVFDGTHSVQRPGGLGSKTGGNREMIPYLTRAAVSIGIAALFLEVHNDPDNAPSDGPNMLKLNELEELLTLLKKFDSIVKNI